MGRVNTDEALVCMDAAGELGRSVKKYCDAGERAPARLACCIIAISSSDSPASASCVVQDGGRLVRLEDGQNGRNKELRRHTCHRRVDGAV